MSLPWPWIAFNALVLAMLAVDLGIFQRRPHEVRTREAAVWSAVWVALSIVFGIVIWLWMGRQAGLEFFAGYLLEKALSVDNIFVFVLIFSFFNVPAKYQHRVLFWGILGALVLRGAMIGIGSLLVSRFEWVLYAFGAFLVLTGIRMAVHRDQQIEPEHNPALRLVRRLLPVTSSYRGPHFFVREPARPGGALRLMATPLFVVLVLVETTDLVFAVDSIPAVFGVTRDPFLVYSSNVLAILGLRALYFLLAGLVGRLRFLQVALALVLVFIGAKMLAAGAVHVPVGISLGVIAVVLAIATAASLLFPAPRTSAAGPPE